MSATELLFQDSILLTEVLDDRILLAGDPAGQGSNEYLPRLKDGGQSEIVARTGGIRQLSSAVRVGLFFPEFRSAENPDTTGSEKVGSSAFSADRPLQLGEVR